MIDLLIIVCVILRTENRVICKLESHDMIFLIGWLFLFEMFYYIHEYTFNLNILELLQFESSQLGTSTTLATSFAVDENDGENAIKRRKMKKAINMAALVYNAGIQSLYQASNAKE
jgi:hypothetical protein